MKPLPTKPISSVVNKNTPIIASPLQKSSELRTLGLDLENGSEVDSDIAFEGGIGRYRRLELLWIGNDFAVYRTLS